MRQSLYYLDPYRAGCPMFKLTHFVFLQRRLFCCTYPYLPVLNLNTRVFDVEASARVCDENIAVCAVDHPSTTCFAGKGSTGGELVG